MIKEQKPVIHLICHAHLDPVWLWQWEDGLTEAMSTFRIACDFCDQERGFIFCHNESLLYEWIEDHDPALFARIKKLVRSSRWHIAGGSFLQPDLNMPAGESLIRQFLAGKKYFREKFGVEPRTAYNFDSFGQSEGFVQILSGCGFDSYIFCRPDESVWHLPMNAFRWRDRSGHEVIARRADNYPTNGQAYKQLNRFMPNHEGEMERLFLWGIGNHGGGPSREDLRGIGKYAAEHKDFELIHSTPENHFRYFLKHRGTLEVVQGEMQNIECGCYTSMSRVKRAYRQGENLMTATERMATMAWWLGRTEYPANELNQAWHDILFSEFHDVLPGSSIQPAEKDTLALLGHCTEILRRTKARIFLRLLRGEPAAEDEVVPVFVWNPHGFAVHTDLECECCYSHINVKYGRIAITVRDAGRNERIVFQRETPENAVASDWRIKVIVPLTMNPYEIRRLEVSWKKRRRLKIWRAPKNISRLLVLKTRHLHVRLNQKTGLLDHAGLSSGNQSWLKEGALQPVIFRDLDHAWECGGPGRKKECLENSLGMYPWEAPLAKFVPVYGQKLKDIISPPSLRAADRKDGQRRLDPVRVVEEGPVRTVFEVALAAGNSVIIRRYILSKKHDWLEIRDRIFWNEKDAMLKIALPLGFKAANTVSEAPYSAVTRSAPKFHVDYVNQRWVAVTEGAGPTGTGGNFVAVLNDGSYGHSIYNNTLFVNVLRSPAYSSNRLRANLDAHELRYWPRQDQGEHEVRFRILFGRDFHETAISRAAQVMNSPPEWMIYYPTASLRAKRPSRATDRFISVLGDDIQVTALKKEENGDGMVVRLWNSSPQAREALVKLAGNNFTVRTLIGPYGLKTVVLSKRNGRLAAANTNLIEK